MDRLPGQQRVFTESPTDRPDAVGNSATAPADGGGDTDAAIEITVESVEHLSDLYRVSVIAHKETSPSSGAPLGQLTNVEVAIMDATLRLRDLTPRLQPVDEIRRGEHRVRTFLAVAIVVPFYAALVLAIIGTVGGTVSAKVLGAIFTCAATVLGLVVRYYFGIKKDGRD